MFPSPASFDPYQRWLGIPPDEQPPHYYRLLGIRDFENDRGMIEAAAARLAMHLQSCRVAAQCHLADKLLREVAVAKACLLDPQRRTTYDAQLRMVLAARSAAGAPSSAALAPATKSTPHPLRPPAPYPGSVPTGPAPVAPPASSWATENLDAGSPLEGSRWSARSAWRQAMRRRKESPGYLVAIIVGVLLMGAFFWIAMASHPFDRFFDRFQEKPAHGTSR